MRVPLSWLSDYVDLPPGETARDIAARLIRVGLEVETVEHAGAEVQGPLVVGRVLEFSEQTHKNGKTIRWCSVAAVSPSSAMAWANSSVFFFATDGRCGMGGATATAFTGAGFAGAASPGRTAASICLASSSRTWCTYSSGAMPVAWAKRRLKVRSGSCDSCTMCATGAGLA